MEKKSLLKKLIFCLCIGFFAAVFAVPVQAAVYKKAQTKMIRAGECYHLIDNNINKNKITRYAVTIMPASSGGVYDLAYASEGREKVLKSCSKGKRFENPTTSYIKSYSQSNTGMAMCIKVFKGSVRVRVDYKAQNKGAALTFGKQAASHKPLLAVSVPKGRQVMFRQRGSNISWVPVVIGAKSGAFTRRDLNKAASTFENYTFMSNYLKFRYYKNGKLQNSSSLNIKYDTEAGNGKFIQVLMPNRNSGWFTTKSGTVTYYFPSDYLNIAVARR